MENKHCFKCGQEGVAWLDYKPQYPESLYRFFRFFLSDFKSRPLCTTHLIQEFSIAFESSTYKYVVFPPIAEKGYLSAGYNYEPLNKTSPLDRISSIGLLALSCISETCSECRQQASVAYFDQEFYEWLKETPEISIQLNPPKSLCKKCTLEKVVPILATTCMIFEEGIQIPHDGDGVYYPEYY
ncbi:MAG: hypothetical protein ING27_03235 [Burkholderiales bacterium]|jgi:hypothetical protein|nr:hypothetical protein [Burkholderiales bacterium]